MDTTKEYEQTITDEASTTVTYVGYTDFGVAVADAKWIIKKIEQASATDPVGVTTIKYATGYNNRTNIWNDRASLSYSS